LDQYRKISWLLLRQRARDHWKFAALGLGLLLLFSALNINQPISRKQMSCRFLKWTTQQDYTGKSTPRVFCKLGDGRTIIARASGNWLPPPFDTEIAVEEQTLLFGTNYRVL